MIQLAKDLVIIADKNCYIVGKPRQRPGKAFEVQNPTYYTTMAQAVQGALNRALRDAVADGSITTLRQFVEEQENFRADLERLLTLLDGGEAIQEVGKAPRAHCGG